MVSSLACGKAVSVGANTVRPGLDFRRLERLVASSAFTKVVNWLFKRSVVIRSPLGTSFAPGAAAGAAAGVGVAAGAAGAAGGAAGAWAKAAPAIRETAAAAVSRRWIGIRSSV